MKRIIFIVPYPLGKAPSQRFRFEQYFEALSGEGYQIDTQSFLSDKGWNILYQKGNAINKAWQVLLGFARRKWLSVRIWKYDFVFIHREASPLGPPIFEWFWAKVLKKKLIYDFDDAIWMADEGDLEGLLLKLKWYRKVASICSWSYKVSCGNEYLRQYAAQFNTQAVYNPTTIQTKTQHNRLKDHQQGLVSIGWTGTHSTLKHLQTLWSVLQKLQSTVDFKFILIANRNTAIPLNNTEFVQWKEETEIDDLLRLDIGLMPLPNDAWSKGKCGFKALQYMALGIPAVASPVGVNTRIIHEGENGFLADSEQEWMDKLLVLIQQVELRKQVGMAGRKTIEDHYSVSANSANFLSLFT